MTRESTKLNIKADPAAMTWTVHPARQRPRQMVLAGLAVVGLSIGAGLFGGGFWWGLLALLVLFGALNRFFMPSTFVLDSKGVEARYPLKKQRLTWNRIRRFLHDENGGYLSTRGQRSWTDAYRGIHILFDDNRAQQIKRIRLSIEQAAADRQSASNAPDNSGDRPDQPGQSDHRDQGMAMAGGEV